MKLNFPLCIVSSLLLSLCGFFRRQALSTAPVLAEEDAVPTMTPVVSSTDGPAASECVISTPAVPCRNSVPTRTYKHVAEYVRELFTFCAHCSWPCATLESDNEMNLNTVCA